MPRDSLLTLPRLLCPFPKHPIEIFNLLLHVGSGLLYSCLSACVGGYGRRVGICHEGS
jgi:hypothetical protein